jgi:hypothetical protein
MFLVAQAINLACALRFSDDATSIVILSEAQDLSLPFAVPSASPGWNSVFAVRS